MEVCLHLTWICYITQFIYEHSFGDFKQHHQCEGPIGLPPFEPIPLNWFVKPYFHLKCWCRFLHLVKLSIVVNNGLSGNHDQVLCMLSNSLRNWNWPSLFSTHECILWRFKPAALQWKPHCFTAWAYLIYLPKQCFDFKVFSGVIFR